MRWWHWINRRTDLRILWPICKEHSLSLGHAKAAFYLHAINDTAWTDHYTEEELKQFVEDLS